MDVKGSRSVDALMKAAYPELARIDDAEWKQAVDNAKEVHVVAGSVMLHDQLRAKDFKLLMTGSVRVYHTAPDGREITLYRVNAGDLCVLSLNSLFNEETHGIISEAETDLTLLCIDEKSFHMIMQESAIFRSYVLAKLCQRTVDIMSMVQDAVFNTLGLRLACLLGQLFEREKIVKLKITHQLLADELGSTREVISRILKEFERKGCLKLGRGYIQLASQQVLADFSHIR